MRSVLLLLATLALGSAGEAPRLLPPDATKGDVVRDFGAKGDGTTDDTQAIQAALSAGLQIIYLPPGTYRISATLRWGPGEKRQTLEGAGPEHTRLRLADRAPGFGDTTQPRALIWTGRAPAQRFRNGLRSLSIETGEGNPGAIGAQFMTSNQGGISDVVFRSGSPAGPIGLDLGYSDEQGPILVQRVTVEGFATGISLKGSVNSATFEHITLKNQGVVGLRNQGQCISVRGLISDNRVTALDNADGWSTATLLDAQLRGGTADAPAIRNAGTLFVRRADTTGYGTAVSEKNGAGGHGPGQVREYASQPIQALFPTSPARSLDLPVEETPTAPWPKPDDWISVTAFASQQIDLPGRTNTDGSKAAGEAGRPRTITDWSKAFQQAIDSGKPVVYFPNGTYEMHGTVEIRGAVRRIIGFESAFGKWGRLELHTATNAQAVRIERFDWMYNHLILSHRGPQSLTLATVIKGCDYGVMTKEAGSGDLFFEDISLHPGGKLTLHGGRTFARQLNTEGGNSVPAQGERDSIDSGSDNVLNRGGSLWILGLKTENDGTLITTVEGGRTEIVGGLCYANKAYRPVKQWFVTVDSDLSFTLGENVMRNAPFDPVVERRGSDTRVFPKGRMAVRGTGSAIALFSAWRNPAKAAPTVTPTALAVTPEGTSILNLKWTPPAADGLDGLALEVASGDAPFALVTVLPPQTASYSLTKLAPSTSYRVRVSAANGAGTGAPAEVTATTDKAAPPATGTGLHASWWKDATRRTVIPAAAPGAAGRLSGSLVPRFDETYRIGTGLRNSRVWIDGRLILDLAGNAKHITTGPIELHAGQPVSIVVEVVLREPKAALNLTWSSPSQSEESIPVSQLIPDPTEPPGYAVTLPTKVLEGGELTITVSRTGPTTAATAVPLTASGDWELLALEVPEHVTIPAGETKQTAILVVPNDKRPAPDRQLGLSVTPGPAHLVLDAPASCVVRDEG